MRGWHGRNTGRKCADCMRSGNKPSETQAPEQTEVAKETDAPVADNGELKEVYVFIRDRGDLSYWDSMAEGADRSVTDYADRANVHVVETTGRFASKSAGYV